MVHSEISLPSDYAPGGSEVKASACNAGDPGSIPGSGRSPGEGNGNLLQYSCQENLMDGGAWLATVHGVAKSRTRLSDFTFTFTFHPSTTEYTSFKRHIEDFPRQTTGWAIIQV